MPEEGLDFGSASSTTAASQLHHSCVGTGRPAHNSALAYQVPRCFSVLCCCERSLLLDVDGTKHTNSQTLIVVVAAKAACAFSSYVPCERDQSAPPLFLCSGVGLWFGRETTDPRFARNLRVRACPTRAIGLVRQVDSHGQSLSKLSRAVSVCLMFCLGFALSPFPACSSPSVVLVSFCKCLPEKLLVS